MDKPKLFFSYSHKDREIIEPVRQVLLKEGYVILSDNEVHIGEDFSFAILQQIKQADYYLVFLSENYLSSNSASSEFNKLLGYSQSTSKSLLPILVGPAKLPSDMDKLLYLNVVGQSPETISNKIIFSISKIEGQKEAEKQKIAERLEKINISIVDYIEPILKDLREREDKLRRVSNTWNVLGYFSIVLGVLASIVLVIIDVKVHFDINLQRIIYLAIKGAILLILLLTSSKYAFTLSKSYMNESLKNADRMHAISFGKFYIRVFEQSINPIDFKEIFQNWNLSKDSSFSSLSTDSYDPKIFESMSKIFETIKDITKK